MDDKVLRENQKKLAALDRQLSDLAIKQRTTEGRLAQEHELVRRAVSQRAAVVGGLIDADEEAAKKLHRQLDSLDQQIKSSERMAESLQNLLRGIAAETADTTSQRDKLNQVVASENTSREFALWQADMTGNFAAAREAMAAARIALGKLTTTAARGVERFQGAASGWAAGEFDRFEHVEANPDSLGGFKPALPLFRSIVVHVSPMERR